MSKEPKKLPTWLTDKYDVYIIKCRPKGMVKEVSLYDISKEDAAALAKSHPDILSLKKKDDPMVTPKITKP